MVNFLKGKIYDGLQESLKKAQQEEMQCFRVLRYSLQQFDVQRVGNKYYLLYNGEGIAEAYVQKFFNSIINYFHYIIIEQCRQLDAAENS